MGYVMIAMLYIATSVVTVVITVYVAMTIFCGLDWLANEIEWRRNNKTQQKEIEKMHKIYENDKVMEWIERNK